MDLERKERVFHRISWTLFLFFILTPIFLVNGIPFLETDYEISKGEADGFEVGMTKEKCFVVLKQKHNDQGVRFFARRYLDEKISNDFEDSMTEISEMNEIMREGQYWSIDYHLYIWYMGTSLSFSGDTLTRIQHHRFIFHRDAL